METAYQSRQNTGGDDYSEKDFPERSAPSEKAFSQVTVNAPRGRTSRSAAPIVRANACRKDLKSELRNLLSRFATRRGYPQRRESCVVC